MEPSTQTETNLVNLLLKILLVIIFFPFFFTYWIYKQNWDAKAKFAFMFLFWTLLLIAASTNFPGEPTSGNRQKNIISKVPPPASPTPEKFAPSISQSPPVTITNPPFDKNLGNNPLSAGYAKQYMDFADKTAPGAVKNVYLELSPADPEGKTDSFLTITVNSFYWNFIDDPNKKNLITLSLTKLKSTFLGDAHIIINDGTKTLATGDLPALGSNPTIILK